MIMSIIMLANICKFAAIYQFYNSCNDLLFIQQLQYHYGMAPYLHDIIHSVRCTSRRGYTKGNQYKVMLSMEMAFYLHVFHQCWCQNPCNIHRNGLSIQLLQFLSNAQELFYQNKISTHRGRDRQMSANL